MEDDKLIKAYFVDGKLDIKQIVNEFSNYVFTIIKNMPRDMLRDEDVEEMISDVFLVVWKNQKKLKKDKFLKPYISGVTKNVVKSTLRDNQKLINLLNLEENTPMDFNIMAVLEEKERNEIIFKELENSEIDYKIFKMFYYEGQKTRKIAKELGYTEFNINTKLHRIRRRIKNALVERGYNYGK